MWLVNVHDVMSTKVVTHSVPPNWPVLVAARRGRDPGPRPELHLLPRPWRLLATTARRPRRRRSGRAAGGSRSCGPGALGPSSERGRLLLRAVVARRRASDNRKLAPNRSGLLCGRGWWFVSHLLLMIISSPRQQRHCPQRYCVQRVFLESGVGLEHQFFGLP